MNENNNINEDVRDVNIECFDELVERFMRSELPADEESALKQVLAENAELRKRARTMALMVRAMKEDRKEEYEQIKEEIGKLQPDKTLLFVTTDKGATCISELPEDVHYRLVNPHRYVSTTPQPALVNDAQKPSSEDNGSRKLRWFKRSVVAYLVLLVVGGIAYEIFAPQDEPVVFTFAGMPTDSGALTLPEIDLSKIDVSSVNLYASLATDQFYSSVRTVTLDDLMHTRGDAEGGLQKLMQLFDNVKQGHDLSNTADQLQALLIYASTPGETQLADSTMQQMADLLCSTAEGRPMLSDFVADIAWNLTFAHLKQNDGAGALNVLNCTFGQCKNLPTEISGLITVLSELVKVGSID